MMNTSGPLYNAQVVFILSEGFGRGAGDKRPMARLILLILVIGFSFVGGVSPYAAASGPLPQASDARLAGDAKRTRLVVDLSEPVALESFLLADPYRVVVDLPEIAFTVKPEVGRHGRGLVSAFRFGLIAAGRSRIVLDLTGPALIDKAFVLDPVEGQPARLVIDLVASDRDAFVEAAARQKGIRPGELTGSLDAVAAPAPPGASGLPVIVIDPGHGGIDSGAVTAKGDQEKTIVLDFASTLAAKIDATKRYRAILTRSDDTFVTLAGRIAVARTNQAALFISIHADTLPDPFGVRGATIYTLSDHASDAETARYAEKENRADLIAGVNLSAEPDDVADILIDLTRRETKSFSSRFAKVLVDQFRQAATLNKNPHRSAGFLVLKAPDVPSVLLELGYLSNSQDVKLLTSDEWRGRATDAVLAAIEGFFSPVSRDASATSN
jgi:N-acetylmuramoyl-L-alanine amidase